jgi:AraC family transcriptional regulator, ethanolamine operon transcriptional activator
MSMDYQRLNLKCCDPEQLVDVIDGTSLHHRVLPGGALSVDVEKLRLGPATFTRGHYGMGILADGALTGDLITVGIVLASPAEVTVNGFVCPPLSVQLYAEGCELTYRAPPGSTWFAYSIERVRIQQAALALYGRPLPIPPSGSVSNMLDRPAQQRIASGIRALFTAAIGAGHDESADQVCTAIEDRLRYELAGALEDAGDTDDQRHVEQRRRLMARSEEYLRANLSEVFSLSDFAAATGASPRMLEHHFRRIYGVTPHAWYRSMKLNGVRRDLKKARNTGERISDIAMRWGFLHFGRFSKEYRWLFGERPRDTLRR